MAPAPTTPMRSGAVAACGSLDRANRSAGIVGAKDRAEVLPRARAADCAALAHAHAVPVAAALEEQLLHAAAAGNDVDGKIGAVQQLASRRAQRRANLVAPQRPAAAIRVHRERAH